MRGRGVESVDLKNIGANWKKKKLDYDIMNLQKRIDLYIERKN